MKIIDRDIREHLLYASKYFPVVTILGPRQSGKTTLARLSFPGYKYVNLEDPEILELVRSDMNGFLEMLGHNAIIDEIQKYPMLLDKIQTVVDERKENGQYILTGSFQQALKSSIAQSLAGRTAVLNLLPLSIRELERSGISFTRDEYIYQGFMPRHYSENQPIGLLYSSYYQTYVERDVQAILNVKNKNLFDKFMHIIAGRIGQIINLQSLANDVGISSTTVNEWISILESSYIVFRVEPYYENYTKRVIKAPKLYFTDIGLACYLLGIKDPSQVYRDPLVGNLFENMVISEILKAQYNQGRDKEIYFFRDSKGFEVDAIIPNGREFTPIEIKSASTFSKDFSSSLRKMVGFAKEATNPTVIYSGDKSFILDGVKYINFKDTSSII